MYLSIPHIDSFVLSDVSCINNLQNIEYRNPSLATDCNCKKHIPVSRYRCTSRPFASSAFPWVVQRRRLATARCTSVEPEAVNVVIGAWTAIHIRNSARFFPLPPSTHRVKLTNSSSAVFLRGVSSREENRETERAKGRLCEVMGMRE